MRKKKKKFISFNTEFYGFIYWRQSQEYRTFWVTQYLPTPELEIFVGEYSLTSESGMLQDDHKNITQTKPLAILDKTSNAPSQVGRLGGDNIFPFA